MALTPGQARSRLGVAPPGTDSAKLGGRPPRRTLGRVNKEEAQMAPSLDHRAWHTECTDPRFARARGRRRLRAPRLARRHRKHCGARGVARSARLDEECRYRPRPRAPSRSIRRSARSGDPSAPVHLNRNPTTPRGGCYPGIGVHGGAHWSGDERRRACATLTPMPIDGPCRCVEPKARGTCTHS
jgi:hypothetical protein